MGMDLVTTLLYHPKGLKLDWKAGRDLLRNITIEDVVDYGDYMWDAPDPDEQPEEYVNAVKVFYTSVLDEMEAYLSSYPRDLNVFGILGHTLYVAGGDSFGDISDGADLFSSFYLIPKVVSTIGFIVE